MKKEEIKLKKLVKEGETFDFLKSIANDWINIKKSEFFGPLDKILGGIEAKPTSNKSLIDTLKVVDSNVMKLDQKEAFPGQKAMITMLAQLKQKNPKAYEELEKASASENPAEAMKQLRFFMSGKKATALKPNEMQPDGTSTAPAPTGAVLPTKESVEKRWNDKNSRITLKKQIYETLGMKPNKRNLL